MRKIYVIIIALLSCIPAFSEPFTLVGATHKSVVVVPDSEPEYVLLAARDLVSDVKKITGEELSVIRSSRPRKGSIFVSTKIDGRWEAYSIESRKDVLYLTGSDPRGTMYAVYQFIEDYLGVDPLSYWNGASYPHSEELSWKEISFRQDSPSFKFRGWFINDEELLTAWLPSGGKRRTDYPYYGEVVNPKAMEHIAEALVRCRFNLIIPASLLNIANPPEAKLAEICARRGVFLSMHHVEPMGTSAWTYFYYWKDRGRDLPFSYWSNPDEVEQVWRETATRWAKFPNVIWQIGLRGVGDRPIWMADSTIPTSDQDRAEIISRAMARQMEILDEIGVPREGRLVSTTLWAEGAVFNKKGYLKIPEGTKIIFADNNPGWHWQTDFYSTERKSGYKYGVYYHPALIDSGPHLASMVPVSKTASMLREAYDSGASDYAILNVSNVREFTYNIEGATDILWDIKSFDPKGWTEQWVYDHFDQDCDKWITFYNQFYKSLQINPANDCPAFLDGHLNGRADSLLCAMERIVSGSQKIAVVPEPFGMKDDSDDEHDAFWKSLSGMSISRYPSPRIEYSAACAQRASFELALALAEELYASLPVEKRPFALTTALYPSKLMYNFTDYYCKLFLSCEYLQLGSMAKAENYCRQAEMAISKCLALKDIYCVGEFEGWWNDCRKIPLGRHFSRIQKLHFQ